MSQDSGAAPTKAEQGQEKRHPRIGLAAAILLLIISTGLGSVLLNVDWPGGGLAWLRVVVGSVLLTVALLLGEFVIHAFRALHDKTSKDDKERIINLLSWVGTGLKEPRRIFPVLTLAAALILVILLVVPPLFSLPTREPDIPPGDLVLMSAIDESPSDPRQILIRQWNQTHPDNIVRVENVSGETDAQHRDMVEDAKKNHRADIYLLDVVWMTEFIENGYIQRLDDSDLSSDDFLENVLRTCTDQYGGRDGLWALPFNSDAGLLFYRADIPAFTNLTAWDEYFGTAAKNSYATAKRIPGPTEVTDKLLAANVAQLADEEIRTVTILEAMWAAQGDVVNLDGRLVINQGAVAFDSNALAGLKKLAAAYKDRQITQPDSGDTDDNDAINVFKDGQTLFMRNWPVAYDALRSQGDASAFPFGVTNIPKDKSVLGGQNLAISSTTDNSRAAQAFIEFLTSAPSQLILFETGGFAPTRTSAYDNASRPYRSQLRDAVANARPRPLMPCYTEFSMAFRKGLWQAIIGDGTFDDDLPKELARIANKKC